MITATWLNVLMTLAILVLFVVGIVGCFVPVIPGPPLAALSIVGAFFCKWNNIALWVMILCIVVSIASVVLDNILPAIMTKKAGGSKAGTRGCTIGLIIGMFIGPWGIIIGPFCGALIGELIHDHSQFKKCLKAAGGAFLGFLAGVGQKLIIVLTFIWIYILSFFIGK